MRNAGGLLLKYGGGDMPRVAVMTDSNSGITQLDGKNMGVGVMPMPFTIDGKIYYEDISLSREEFFQMMADDKNILSSQPAPADLLEMWDKALEKYRQALRQRDIKQDNDVKLKTKNSRSYVECTINDGKNQLLQISMYAPNAEQASVVKNVFYNNTDVIYQAVVALMTGDKKTALNIIAAADFSREDFI